MTRRVTITPPAQRQINTAEEWWSDHRDKAPDAFESDLQEALTAIAENPGLGAIYRRRSGAIVRRIVLRRIRYHLYYRLREDDGAIDVLALWHMSRGTPPRI